MTEVPRITLRAGNLSLQSRVSIQREETIEIVRWHDGGDTCDSIAVWGRSSDGYYLTFVGSRPLAPNVDRGLFWQLAEIGQAFADKVLLP